MFSLSAELIKHTYHTQSVVPPHSVVPYARKPSSFPPSLANDTITIRLAFLTLEQFTN